MGTTMPRPATSICNTVAPAAAAHGISTLTVVSEKSKVRAASPALAGAV